MHRSEVIGVLNKKRMNNRDLMSPEEAKKTLGNNLSFAAAEAYKLLRTNLNFSIPNGNGCKIIGVTSALKGEGKSTTSVNIAYTMAQEGGKVLLIECDLRLPTLAKRIQVNAAPGLSNFLVGECTSNDILQKSGIKSNLWVVTAGDIPPNPAELLGSENMKTTIQTLKEYFDVIILDLPPLSAVSDALIVSKLVHGMVLIVRQGYCDRRSIDEAIHQLRFADAKILGFVMTGANTLSKNYKRYGKSYGYYKQAQAK